jgi:nitrite reductase/ring-hydroxylating ferredoxin subunit/DMSO/TMAO reductase YedYZ heme-binding membrane subunit
MAAYAVVTRLTWHGPNPPGDEVLLLRATGTSAIVMLHAILCIGPLARLDARFLPILYNRRHLGVMTFFVALVHGIVAIGYYHGFGVVNPLISLIESNTNFTSLRAFPFQLLGLFALAILFLLAATSHDFWLKNLSASTWKRLHMLVYVAYALLVGHVALGALQTPRSDAGAFLIGAGVLLVVGLHIAAGLKERRADRLASPASDSEWVDAGTAADIPLDRARIICAARHDAPPERIAIFRHNGGISAITNVCAHQGGPLGEGKVIDGCVTCPWHGWQYRPHDGCAPPPFVERVTTYQVRVVAGRVQVNPRPLPPGTPVVPASIQSREDADA